ncbi:hypothetical protein FC83_GL000446 [Agrilactobacillus composti DSM 18527 = JCM 14202]|uniref:Uncharacterized protein n=1 Tax=Agrilactobacillus composti DSM 18527 = JCM 14202 TaxID=1423734 RepID=A0A0R1Y010_9LACO|nr:hypothetical protein FC83_GL000446 [Agrilactobacillus composti DSM 18527 = JCM 14202]
MFKFKTAQPKLRRSWLVAPAIYIVCYASSCDSKNQAKGPQAKLSLSGFAT